MVQGHGRCAWSAGRGQVSRRQAQHYIIQGMEGSAHLHGWPIALLPPGAPAAPAATRSSEEHLPPFLPCPAQDLLDEMLAPLNRSSDGSDGRAPSVAVPGSLDFYLCELAFRASSAVRIVLARGSDKPAAQQPASSKAAVLRTRPVLQMATTRRWTAATTSVRLAACPRLQFLLPAPACSSPPFLACSSLHPSCLRWHPCKPQLHTAACPLSLLCTCSKSSCGAFHHLLCRGFSQQ